ncbi:rhodanese-like domain-containing protein 10 [Selaginella moellendorffii]|nr:rhodanese-like domain-containing protein 10 [Selaginella moellendorffii]|eukprot:XP_002979309.2 rhodanese-like domain-containing protein 10 [Selaginella moellendorffii]
MASTSLRSPAVDFQRLKRNPGKKFHPVPSASMRDAKELVQSGAVIAVSPKEAKTLISERGFKLLDVRPIWERQKSFVAESIHVPLFVEDDDLSPITLLKKWIHFGYIGMWMGHKLTAVNIQFLDQALDAAARSKDSKLLIACGEGLRSLLAIEKLHGDGFTNLAWLDGGFGAAKRRDFEGVEGTELRFASIGGFAQYFLQIILFFQRESEEP